VNTIDLPLSDSLQQFVAQRAAQGGFTNSRDYILALLEQERRAEGREGLEAKLLQGLAELDRGEGQPMTSADWDRLRAQVRARHGAEGQA